MKAPGHERRPALVAAGVLVVAVMALWAHAFSYRFISDDAYISFRYSYNFAYHGELVFNLGARVEGYTNFLWTVLLGLLLKAGLSIEIMSQLLGGLFGAAVLVLVYLLGRLYRGGRPTPWELLAPVLLAATGGFAVWCSGGLETQLFAALVLGGITASIAERGGQLAHPYSAALFALAAMTRPEGLFFFGLTGLHRYGANVIAERRWWPKASDLAWALAFLMPFGLFFLWRYDYYGYPFPNTFYVKAGGEPLQMMRKWGLPYLWDFIQLNRLYLLLPFIALLWRPRTAYRAGQLAPQAEADRELARAQGPSWLDLERGHGRPLATEGALAGASEAEVQGHEGKETASKPPPPRRIAVTVNPAFVWSYLALLVLPFVVYVCYVGGDFMAMGRFFVPVLPLIVFAAQEGAREAIERGRAEFDSWRASRFVPTALLLVGAFAANAVWLHRDNRKLRYHRWGLDTVAYLRKFAADRIKVGRWLREKVPADTYLSVGGAGAIVYASRLRALDTFGLNDRWIAHQGPRTGDRPGHSKSAPGWYIDKQRPDLMCHRAQHQDWPYRPNAGERAYWRRKGYAWVCIDPPGLRPRYYCCLKRLDRDLGVWPAERSAGK